MNETATSSRRLRYRAVWIGAITVLSVGFAIVRTGTVNAAPQSLRSTFDAPANTRSFADVVEQVSPSVVKISVTKKAEAVPTSMFRGQEPRDSFSPYDDFFGPFFDMPGMVPQNRGPTQALGSGFVIDKAGYIVTNNHVVEGASKIVAVFRDGKELDATLIGTDPKTDLAVLKVESAAPLPVLTFGNSDDARIGDWVLAIGNPFGLGGSATAGIISARGRDIRSGPYDDYLQIDAPINSGNSGGPVLNADGQVIGVNTAIYSPNGGNVGIGFAIPSKQVSAVVDELKASGTVRRGWLGVQIQDVDQELASGLGLDRSTGALVGDVVENSPAAAAGLKVGDVIVAFDGKDIDTAKALSLAVATADPADTAPVRILRDQHEKTLHVRLGEAEQAAEAGPMHSSDAGPAAELGLSLAELTDSYRRQLGLPDDCPGVVVSDVNPDSDAALRGLRPGDVISRVGSTEVNSVADARNAINEAKSRGDHAALLVRRDDAQQFVSVAFS